MNLTKTEIEIINNLADAWNKFCTLEDSPERDQDEFATLINAAQARIAIRVARRVDPGVWRQD